MAAFTYTELVTAVTSRNRRTNSASQIGENVIFALTKIGVRFRVPALQALKTSVTTTASTATTAVADDFVELYDENSLIYDVEDEGRNIEVLHPEVFIADYPRPQDATEDEPQKCMVYGGKFYWYPVPDDAYAIKYYYMKEHPTISGSTTHSLGAKFNRAIIALANAYTYEDFQEYVDAQYWFNIAEMELSDIMGARPSGIRWMKRDALYA
ncbi:hypothetical protein KKF61_09210 [Patescibacteria group bacterium]|nr:hypothetical protein [Patescibacteria group bacterium]